MTQEEYIRTHPEQFKDDIDKWLFLEFGIIGGCCSSEKSHEYHIARMVAEKLADAFIEKACNAYCKVCGHFAHSVPTHICRHDCRYFSDFKNYMKGE